MKHVFFVHSHTTFLSAVGTIHFLNLPIQNVLFIITRNYSCKYLVEQYKFTDISLLQDEYYSIKFNRNAITRCLVRIDHVISKYIDDKYVAYVPHSGLIYQAFITHSNCVAFNYIQESGGDFFNAFSLKNFLYKIQNLWISNTRYYRHRGWDITPNIKMKSRGMQTFSINPQLYKELDCKHSIIKWPCYKLDISINEDYPVFVFDAVYENGYINRAAYLDGCKLLIENNCKSVNYVKFHPYQKEECKQQILRYFKDQGVIAELLPQDVPFELILSSYANLKVIGFCSSLVYFAKQTNHEVISGNNLLMKKSKSFAKHVKELEKNIK